MHTKNHNEHNDMNYLRCVLCVSFMYFVIRCLTLRSRQARIFLINGYEPMVSF